MRISHKPLSQQVILITGASSGIGRQTAIRAAHEGAKVVLVARNRDDLESAVAEITSSGGEAIFAVADVAEVEQLKAAADAAVQRFGRIDTWVNNAGVGMYSRLLETDVADDRRLFETNFWGIVNGSRIGVEYLKRAGGGSLINVGSEVSDISMPVMGMYSTSKHAVMGFTDALRDELLESKAPISVTLIKPSAINTPFPRHAKNYYNEESTLPAPVYNVNLVADQILYAAENGGRELYVGGGGRAMVFAGNHFPSVMDWIAAKFMPAQQFAKRPADHSNESLHQTRGFNRAHGDVDRDRHVQNISLYGIARRNPVTTGVLLAVCAAALGVVAKKEFLDEPEDKSIFSIFAKLRQHSPFN